MKHAWLPAAALLALSGCGGDEPPPVTQNFAPLRYDYLSKIRLNVGTIEVIDHSVPVSPQDLAASSPAVPAQALAQMARDRLFAAGTAGTADFIIDQSSMVREPNGALDGTLAFHLDLLTPSGTHGGYAEARVAREHIPGSDPEDQAATMYALTRQMMEEMNVELEYQIRHSLGAWLVVGSAVPTPVVAQPLGGPAQPTRPAAPPIPAPALPPAAPEASPPPLPAPLAPSGYQDPAAPMPEQQMSPPPGYLQPPITTPSALPPALPPPSGTL